MALWLDTAIVLIVFLGLFILSSQRLGTIIKTFALQSFVLSIIPFLLHNQISVHSIVISLGTLILKVCFVPYVLFWAIRHVSIRREEKPIISYGKTILLGGVFIIGSFILSRTLILPGEHFSNLLVPASFSIIMMGFLLLMSRTKAITQVVGYLVMENGIFLFAFSLVGAMPFLVEMGILLDVFVGIFIMGIVVNHISETFEHPYSTILKNLKD